MFKKKKPTQNLDLRPAQVCAQATPLAHQIETWELGVSAVILQAPQLRVGFDLSLPGLAKTLLRERGWRPDVVGRITWDTGSGHRTDNGVALSGIESVGGSLSFGTALAVSPTNSLFASISNQYINALRFDDERIDGSEITSITLNLGASTSVSRGLLLNLTPSSIGTQLTLSCSKRC